MTEIGPERWHPDMPGATRYGLRGLIAAGYRIEVGDYTYGVPRVAWKANEKTSHSLTIGRFGQFAEGVLIFVGTQGRHPTDFVTTYPVGMLFGPFKSAEVSAAHQGNLSVSIGSDVWIGRDVQIQGGVTIGHGASIGARSTVMTDIPPYAVAVGTPARVTRLRFAEHHVAQLLDLCWWDLEPSKLRSAIDLFRTTNIDVAIAGLRSTR